MHSATNSLETLLLWLRTQNFTGAVTLHVRGGVPREATWGSPNRVYFTSGDRSRQGAPPPQALDRDQPAVAVSPQKKT